MPHPTVNVQLTSSFCYFGFFMLHLYNQCRLLWQLRRLLGSRFWALDTASLVLALNPTLASSGWRRI